MFVWVQVREAALGEQLAMLQSHLDSCKVHVWAWGAGLHACETCVQGMEVVPHPWAWRGHAGMRAEKCKG